MVNKTYHPEHDDENYPRYWQNPLQHQVSHPLRVPHPASLFPQHWGNLIRRMSLICKNIQIHINCSLPTWAREWSITDMKG